MLVELGGGRLDEFLREGLEFFPDGLGAFPLKLARSLLEPFAQALEQPVRFFAEFPKDRGRELVELLLQGLGGGAGAPLDFLRLRLQALPGLVFPVLQNDGRGTHLLVDGIRSFLRRLIGFRLDLDDGLLDGVANPSLKLLQNIVPLLDERLLEIALEILGAALARFEEGTVQVAAVFFGGRLGLEVKRIEAGLGGAADLLQGVFHKF